MAEAPHAAGQFSMKKILARLGKELRTRGGAGFLRFLALRLVQWRGDNLYEIDLRQLGAMPAPVPGLILVDRYIYGSEATRAVEDAVLTESQCEYRDELRGDAMMFVVTGDKGQVASFGFVLFDSFYKRILGESRATPMICNCFTYAQYRGQGLYPQLIQGACHSLAAQGFERAIITCDPDNAASIRGIEKAGFTKVKTLYSLVLVTRWIAWRRILPAPVQSR
jgi:RimJ/RimL family protein N-acetyltransferase